MSGEQQSSAPHGPQVSLRGVSVGFGSQPVLRSIDLEVPRGQTLVIIGESGCGKTVLLKTMIGLVRPAEGTVLFDAMNLAELSDRDLMRERQRMGFLFQSAALFDSMTVGQNVGFPLRENTTTPAAKIDEIVLARLAEVGLPESVIVKKPATLSGGMRKRVGLARALAMDPELMLYDEPTTGLDPIMSDVINELVIRTRERLSVTSIVVTHDMHTVERVADRVVMLFPVARLDGDESQIIFDGTHGELMKCRDPRVSQFVRGEAGERLMEMRKLNGPKAAV